MGKIKKILENELVGGTQTTDVYPVTSVKAVYDEENERLDNIINRRGIVNISTNYNSDHIAESFTLTEAINKVPSKDRVLGFTGRYLSNGSNWKTICYIGSSTSTWNDVSNWIYLLDNSDITHELGDSENAVISQKTVTDRIKENGPISNLMQLSKLSDVDKIPLASVLTRRGYYNSTTGIFVEGTNYCSYLFFAQKGSIIKLSTSETTTFFSKFDLSFGYKERVNSNTYVAEEDEYVGFFLDAAHITIDNYYAYCSNKTVSDRIKEKRVLFVNSYTSEDVSSLSEALQKIPESERIAQAILFYRNQNNNNDYSIYASISNYPTEDNWFNENYWIKIPTIKTLNDTIKEFFYREYTPNNPIYNFNGETSYITFNSPILLSENGDSLTIFLSTDIESALTLNGYGFARGKNDSEIAIGVSKDSLAIRDDDNNWVILKIGSLEKSDFQKLQIIYEEDKIKVYRNDTLLTTKDTQTPITIYSFGNGGKNLYGHWIGSIYEVEVNGSKYLLDNNNSVSHYVNITETELPDRYVEKIGDTLNVYLKQETGNYILYPLEYRYEEYVEGEYPSFYDNHGIGVVKVVEKYGNFFYPIKNLFLKGEVELAINTKKSDDTYTYVGGAAHGFENMTKTGDNYNFLIFIDNIDRTNDESYSRSFQSIEVVQESELFVAYTNSNPFAKVTKKWAFDSNCAKIDISVNILSDCDVSQGQFGMLPVYRRENGSTNSNYITKYAKKMNKPFTTFTLTDGWSSSDLQSKDYSCKQIIEWGELGFSFSLKIEDSNIKSGGGMFVTTNGQQYNKIYFDLTGNTSLVEGEELHSSCVLDIKQILS